MSLVCVFRELYQFGNSFSYLFISHPDAKVVEDLLEAEKMKTDDFSNEIQKLQKDVQTLSEQTQQSQEKEKALTERCKEQVILLSFPFSSLSSSPLSGTATSICQCIC